VSSPRCESEISVLASRPKLQGSICQVWPLALIGQIKRQVIVKGREGGIPRKRQSKTSAHFQGIDMSRRFK
jgi:hypothetical protein